MEDTPGAGVALEQALIGQGFELGAVQQWDGSRAVFTPKLELPQHVLKTLMALGARNQWLVPPWRNSWIFWMYGRRSDLYTTIFEGLLGFGRWVFLEEYDRGDSIVRSRLFYSRNPAQDMSGMLSELKSAPWREVMSLPQVGQKYLKLLCENVRRLRVGGLSILHNPHSKVLEGLVPLPFNSGVELFAWQGNIEHWLALASDNEWGNVAKDIIWALSVALVKGGRTRIGVGIRVGGSGLLTVHRRINSRELKVIVPKYLRDEETGSSQRTPVVLKIDPRESQTGGVEVDHYGLLNLPLLYLLSGLPDIRDVGLILPYVPSS